MSVINVHCDQCGNIIEVDTSNFTYDEVQTVERQMGPEITFETEFEVQCKCGNVIEETHRTSEYAGNRVF